MDFSRRLKLYLFGLIIGGVLAWLFYGERLLNAAWTPEARIKKRIAATLLRSSQQGVEDLRARSLELEEVKASVPAAEVILKRTRRNGDSMIYVLKAEIQHRPTRLTVLVHRDYESDSTATLLDLSDL
jgi:hypothetical protein